MVRRSPVRDAANVIRGTAKIVHVLIPGSFVTPKNPGARQLATNCQATPSRSCVVEMTCGPPPIVYEPSVPIDAVHFVAPVEPFCHVFCSVP